MDTNQLEAAIVAAGANVAPRVTKEQIDALMARVTYVGGRVENTTSTIVHAFLDGEFLLASGHSACVSPANYNAEIGFEIARDNAAKKAYDQLWQLEGYALRKKLYKERADEPLSPTGLPPHQLQDIDEKADLDDKRMKLLAFISSSDVFGKLPVEEQARLHRQQAAMKLYSDILAERIEVFQ